MKIRTLTVVALAALALASCSSGSGSGTGILGGKTSSTTTSSETTAVVETTTTTTSNHADALPGDLCASIAGLPGLDTKVLDETNKLSAVMSDSAAWSDPATIASLHETGQAMLDEIPAVTDYYANAASQAKDPEVAAALLSVSDLYGKYFATWAQSAVEATDVMTFAMGLLESTGSDEMTGIMSDATDAATTLDTWASANCR